ncbi:MAG: hypothetical protein ACYCY1_17085 [Sulfuriferula sp.]
MTCFLLTFRIPCAKFLHMGRFFGRNVQCQYSKSIRIATEPRDAARAFPRATRFLLPVAWERYRDSVDFSRKSDSTQKTELTRIKPVLAVLGEYSLLALQEAPRLIYDYIDQRSKVVMTRSIGARCFRLVCTLPARCRWNAR